MQTLQHRQGSSVDRTLHHATLTLCSDLMAVEALDQIGRSFALLASFSEEESTAVGLAVREAAANAVKHGNRLDPSKTVAAEFRITVAGLRILISDQGTGFSTHAVADPLHEDNLLKPSGRGLLLMRTIMDEVCFSDPTAVNTNCGTTISLFKKRK